MLCFLVEMAVRRGQRLEDILEILNKYTYLNTRAVSDWTFRESRKKLRMPKLMKNTKNLPAPLSSSGRRGRREEQIVSHKKSKYWDLLVALWQHCSSISWKPRFDSCHTHKPSGLVAQSCNPASGGQGYLDGAGHLGLKTWLGLIC